MKDTLQQVEWSDHLERDIFSQRGFGSFESFWNLEESGTNIEYKVLRIHSNKKAGVKLRQIACIKLEQNVKYFLKRAQGKGYARLKCEFEAYKIIIKFGFKTGKLIAFSFNDIKRQGLMLIKNIGVAICLKDLSDGILHPETVAKYQTNEREILAKLASNIIAYQGAGFFYPDLSAKHIFINLNDMDVYIIDLERFVHKKDSSLLSRLPFVSRFWHYSERMQLLNSISKLKNTSKALKKMLARW